MMTSFINIDLVANDIKIIDIYQYDTKSCWEPFNEDTRTVIIIVYPFDLRNSLNRLYHIRPDCFKPYNDLSNLVQYMLRFALLSGTWIPSRTFMYILESSDPYKYVVTMSINCIDRRFCTAKEIKYRNVILLITREYVLLKSTPGLCVKPCATSLALYLTTSLFLFLFPTKTHLYPKVGYQEVLA
jgi:hypothetical protein